MIARTWRGETSLDDGDRYFDYLQRTGVATCEQTPGNRGVYVLRRAQGDRAEFLFVSLWDSMEAVTGFAGSEPETAVFYPQDDGFLIDRDDFVRHYDVLAGPGEESP